MRILNITLMAAVLAMASCNEEYDPIGPNKPSPVLIVSPLELAYDGTGGSLTSRYPQTQKASPSENFLIGWNQRLSMRTTHLSL